MNKLKYLPQIDSLRAISVIGVIIYHLEINFFDTKLFSGGYVGVDIFFLISGYLITGILYNEFLKREKISFLNFYLRRIRRIIPAILFLLFIVLILSFFLILPKDLVQISEISISNLFFISNIYFHYNQIFYWGDALNINPLLHTWSLSIEEQYYFIFPIIFLICLKIYFIKKNILLFLTISFLFFLLLSNYLSVNHYNFSFYMLPSRVFEFLLGSILVILKINNKLKFNLKHVNSFYGFTIIILSYIFFNDYTTMPSFWTLLPLLGGIIIIIDENKNTFTHVLQNKYIVFIGIISYSLYLWHYPIITFLDYYYIKKNLFYYFYFIFLLVIFSIFSFYFVEQPFRNKLKFSNKKMVMTLSLFFIFIFSLSFYFINSNGFYKNLNTVIKDNIEINPYKLTQEGKICHGRRSNFCNFKSQKAKNDIIFVGDSVAARLAENGLKEDLLNQNYNFLLSTYGGCNFHPGFNLVNKKNHSKRGCSAELQKERLKLIDSKNDSIVIFVGNYTQDFEESFFDNEEGGIIKTPYDSIFQPINKKILKKSERINSLKEGFKNNLYKILNNGNKVVLVYPIPEIGFDVPRKLFINNLINRSFENFSTSHRVFSNRTKQTYKLFDSMNHKNLHKIYPEKIFCNSFIKERCAVYFDNISFFSDVIHPSANGAKLINKLIVDKIEMLSNN
tara:strand:- start:4192 stop:6219 length:2028 start_codon:yes stop_codon:yes gene_type:complete